MKGAYVVFDRDGTLIRHVHHLTDVGDVELFGDVPKGLRAISEKGFRLGIVTNQSVVARGLSTLEQVQEIHNLILQELSKQDVTIDFILTCPHMTEDNCACRKPRVALGERAIAEFNLQPNLSYMVGDQMYDMEFGKNLGLKTIGVRNPALKGVNVDYYCEDILGVVDLLL